MHKSVYPDSFIQRALIESGATCPLKLILKGGEAYSAHYTTLMVNNPVIKEVDSHMKLLKKWLMEVHFGKVPSSNFDANPDDIKLLEFSKSYHQAHIASLRGETTCRRMSSNNRGGPDAATMGVAQMRESRTKSKNFALLTVT